MTLAGLPKHDDLFVVTREEVQLLRFTCDLYSEEESPLGAQLSLTNPGAMELAAKSLVHRGLAESGTFRPQRELLRRLLIVSQPDARIVLVDAAASSTDRIIDAYGRVAAYVRYRRIDDGHEMSSPEELEDIRDRILAGFRPRRSTGDFVDVTLTTTEYFAFSVLAGDLLARRLKAAGSPVRPGQAQPRTMRIRPKTLDGPGAIPKRSMSFVETEGPSVPPSNVFADDDGTPIQGLLRSLPPELSGGPHVPQEEDWDRALESLVEKDIIGLASDRYRLRPYFHDLAEGLASQRRQVLTRFDFGAEDWIVRDATFIAVPGSLFMVRALPNKAIRVMELDAQTLKESVDYVINPMGHADLEALADGG